MTFWGVEVKPNEPYNLDFDEGVVLMLTQATLGVSSSPKKSTLQVKVGDKDPIFVCTLLPEKAESFLLNLEFDEDEDVTFSIVGPTSIHLSGILQTPQENEEDYSDGDFGDDFGEGLVGTDSDENEFGSEDDSDDDSMDAFDEDDTPMISRKSGVVIEEIEDEEKPVSEKGGGKQAKKKKDLPSNGKTPQQIVAKGKSNDELVSEDEDGLPASGSKADKGKTKKNKNDAKDDGKSTSNLKRKVDAIDEDKEPKSDKGKKKNKKNKKKDKIEKDEAEAKTSKIAADEVASVKQGKEEKKTTPVKETKQQPKEKPAKIKTFPNGLVIEDLEMGKPNGKKASSGKKIGVYYIGKLKKNNKIFDSNLSGKPFKFKLGAGQVIKGWDIGVEGMKVGGKRRLSIPPSLGYGASGAGPQIPPNAWLNFDVTLVDVA